MMAAARATRTADQPSTSSQEQPKPSSQTDMKGMRNKPPRLNAHVIAIVMAGPSSRSENRGDTWVIPVTSEEAIKRSPMPKAKT